MRDRYIHHVQQQLASALLAWPIRVVTYLPLNLPVVLHLRRLHYSSHIPSYDTCIHRACPRCCQTLYCLCPPRESLSAPLKQATQIEIFHRLADERQESFPHQYLSSWVYYKWAITKNSYTWSRSTQRQVYAKKTQVKMTPQEPHNWPKGHRACF